MRLNLGCCDRTVPGFVGVDIAPPADIIADLSLAWPWDDSSISEVVAYDILEHIQDKRHTMNELWRVLQPGGHVTIEVPSAAKGDGGFCDPTHLSYWTISDFEYYEIGNWARERFRHNSHYGIKADFSVLNIQEKRYPTKWGGEVYKITAQLQAVKK